MNPSTFYTLGRAELRAGTSDFGSPTPMQPKRLALLAFLAISTHAGTPQSRDRIIAYLWPEANQEEGRAALRQALHHLRQRLSENAISSTADGRVVLDLAEVRCDAVEFETAATNGDDTTALALYRGEFLEGLVPRDTSAEFEEWIDRTRRRLATLAATTAERVTRAAVSENRPDDAERAALRWTEIAPDNEDALRTLLRVLDSRGRASDALTAAERATRDFESRLGVPLSAETLTLVAEIRSRRKAQSDNVVAAASEPDAKNDATNVQSNSESAIAHNVDLRTAHADAAPLVVDGPSRATVEATQVRHEKTVRARIFAFALAAAVVAMIVLLMRKETTTGATDSAGSVATAPVAAPDRIIVTEFRDSGDGLGATIAAALRVDLAQSPSIRVLTGAQTREAARLSKIADGPLLDDSIVRTIAAREGVKAFVAGEINKVAGNWLLTARLVNATNGNALVSARETAEDSVQVLPAIERLSRTLRTKVGTALASQPQTIPLERATTSSLSALRAYSDGIRLLDDGERIKGIARLEEAVKIDTGFATAWRILGSTWSGLDEPARAENALRRAFANRERLTFRERYLLEGSYYRNVVFSPKSAIVAYRTLLSSYPGDVAALNNLALVYVSLDAHAQAESLLVQVIAADSTLVHARLTLAEQIAMQHRHDEADRVMNEAARRFPDHPTVKLTPIYLAASAQRWARAESLATVRLNSGVVGIQRADALKTLAEIEMVRGRVGRAEQHLNEAMNEALKAKSPFRYLTGAITSTMLTLRYRGDAVAAQGILQRALKRVPLSEIDEADRPLGALSYVYLALGQRALAESVVGGRDAPKVNRFEREFVQGLFLVANAHPKEGADALSRVAAEGYGCDMCMLPPVIDARAAAGDVSGAIRAAEEYLASPDIHRFGPDAVELPGILTNLAGWYEQRGDAARARTTWQRLIDLWVDADASLASRVADAKRRAGAGKE